MTDYPFTPAAFRPGDAKKVVGISERKMHELISRGTIKTYRVDGCTLIRTDEALEALCPREE